MKTYYFSSAKSISVFTIMGLISIIMTSCGSYKNSSYYDGDGIYGGSEVKNTDNRPQSDSRESNQYKDYFGSLQKDNEEVEIFTDVDSYNSDNYTNQDDRNEGYESGYSGWGSNPENITVTVYDNNWAWNGWNNYFYGPSYGWGWNMGWNSWYGPNYGWGWNNWYGPGYGYYGWGWNNYYNNYGYYNHHHVYNRGIRGSSFRSDGNRSTIGRRNTTGTRNTNYNGVRRNHLIMVPEIQITIISPEETKPLRQEIIPQETTITIPEIIRQEVLIHHKLRQEIILRQDLKVTLQEVTLQQGLIHLHQEVIHQVLVPVKILVADTVAEDPIAAEEDN